MNDIIFSKSFYFCTMHYSKYHYTDNRKGAPSYYFAYMKKGNCKIVTAEDVVEIAEGDIFYIPDACRYQSYWNGKPDIKFVSLGFLYFPNFEDKSYPVQIISRDKTGDDIYLTAVDIFEKISASKKLTAKEVGMLYTLAGMLMPFMYHRPVSGAKDIVRKATAFFADNPKAKISDAAEYCTVSEAALYLAFKKESNVTPNTLKNNLLLEKAKNILITTDKTIEEVSEVLGFSSDSYFRKKFKEYFKVTPKEMRRKYRM